MTNKHYILVDKKPLESDLMGWAKWIENSENKIVKQDTLPDGTFISTVFLGLDHNYAETGDPVLFETMIFGGGYDQYQERYTTWEDAEKGHGKALKLLGVL